MRKFCWLFAIAVSVAAINLAVLIEHEPHNGWGRLDISEADFRQELNDTTTIGPSREKYAVPTYAVLDAGSGDWDGDYAMAGTYKGRPYYKLDNRHFLCYGGADWAFYDNIAFFGRPGPPEFYYATEKSASPPQDGWTPFTGVAPAPTVCFVGGLRNSPKNR